MTTLCEVCFSVLAAPLEDNMIEEEMNLNKHLTQPLFNSNKRVERNFVNPRPYLLANSYDRFVKSYTGARMTVNSSVSSSIKTEKVSHHTKIHILFILLCFGGNVYQVVKISDEYFHYNIISLIKDEYENTVKFPRWQFYMKMVDVINWTSLFALDHTHLRECPIPGHSNQEQLNEQEMINLTKIWTTSQQIEYLFCLSFNLTVKEWESVMLQMNDIFDSVRVITPYYTSEKFQIQQIFNINCSFKERFRVFTFTLKQSYQEQLYDDEDGINQIKLQMTQSGQLIQFIFKTNDKITNYRISLSTQDEEVTFQTRRITLRYESTRHIIASNEYFTHRLPPPYSSMCKNYSSRYKVHEDCIKEQAVHKYSRLPPGPLITLSESVAINSTHSVRVDDILMMTQIPESNKTWISNMNEITNQCYHFVRQNACRSSDLIPVLLSAQKYPVESVVYTSAFYPSVSVNYVPMIDLTTYITQLCSTFGFWLGISVVHILNSMKKMFIKCYSIIKAANHQTADLLNRQNYDTRMMRMKRLVIFHEPRQLNE